jgi:hypothetical protein
MPAMLRAIATRTQALSAKGGSQVCMGAKVFGGAGKVIAKVYERHFGNESPGPMLSFRFNTGATRRGNIGP